MSSPIPYQDTQILLGSVVYGTMDTPIVILIAAAVVALAYIYVKAYLSEIVATAVFMPIIEEPFFRLGLMEGLFYLMFGMELWMCFVMTTLIFMALHPLFCKSEGTTDRLLRICDAAYIGVICGAFYCLQLEEHYYNVLYIIFTCILINGAGNLMVWLLKKIPFVPVHIVVRVGLAFVYLFQLTLVHSWSYRQIMIPFFLHLFV